MVSTETRSPTCRPLPRRPDGCGRIRPRRRSTPLSDDGDHLITRLPEASELKVILRDVPGSASTTPSRSTASSPRTLPRERPPQRACVRSITLPRSPDTAARLTVTRWWWSVGSLLRVPLVTAVRPSGPPYPNRGVSAVGGPCFRSACAQVRGALLVGDVCPGKPSRPGWPSPPPRRWPVCARPVRPFLGSGVPCGFIAFSALWWTSGNSWPADGPGRGPPTRQ